MPVLFTTKTSSGALSYAYISVYHSVSCPSTQSYNIPAHEESIFNTLQHPGLLLHLSSPNISLPDNIKMDYPSLAAIASYRKPLLPFAIRFHQPGHNLYAIELSKLTISVLYPLRTHG